MNTTSLLKPHGIRVLLAAGIEIQLNQEELHNG